MNTSVQMVAVSEEATPQAFSSGFHQLSHDLRTPLNAINGFAELLLMDEALSPAQVECVRAILTGSETLNAAVFTYLDRADAARIKPGGNRPPFRKRSAASTRGAKRRARRALAPSMALRAEQQRPV